MGVGTGWNGRPRREIVRLGPSWGGGGRSSPNLSAWGEW